jgi:hypothetical protein
MNLDGSGRIMVIEPGDTPPKQWRLSPQALDFTFQTFFDELLESEIRGMSKYHNLEAAMTQTLLGMTSEQVTRIAQKQFELHENTKDEAYDILEQLARFDDFAHEEMLVLTQNVREVLREQFENGRKIQEEILTPEQLQRLAALELIMNSENDIPTLNPQSYASLGLSDQQQEELVTIFRESKAELKEITLSMIYGMQELAKEILSPYRTPNEDDSESFNKKLAMLFETLPQEEIRTIEQKVEAFFAEKSPRKQNAIIERIETKINALLTLQQREQYAKLKKELSEQLELARKEQIAKQKEKKPEDYEWLNSWKPGDPIPEGAVPPLPPSRFPRGL